jgi:pyridoxamine 5'-phosphate oxidase
MNPAIADLRKEYSSKNLLETDIEKNPIGQFEKWWHEAFNSQIAEVNAMTLATASGDGMPSARIMLLKGFDKNGFVFFTNYKSYKAMHLEENPKACLVFFWKELERQVRITGLVKRVPEKESDEYFLSRPVGSQVGAWTSNQSQVIESRQWLEDRYLKLTEEFKQKELKRPAHWGGYLVTPVIVEFWQGRPSRLHDRIQYTLENDGTWTIERLSP